MKKITILIFLLLLSLTCGISALSARRNISNEPDQPQWLINPHSQYPESMYLVTIGEGDSRNRAEADAASKLAKIFETRVESEFLFKERYNEIVTDQSFQTQTQTDLDRSVSLKASQTLYNIQYADSYTDNMGRLSILAYIDRHKTADIYMDMIDNHNQQIGFFINKADLADNDLHKYAYRSAAAVISTANETLFEQLQIIAPDYKAMIMLDYNHNELIYDTRNLAHNLSFSINLVNDRENRLHSVLADLLTEHGFTIRDNAEIDISGEILLEDVDLQRPEKFVRWHLSLHMKNTSSQTLISHSQRGREGHLNQQEAVARAFRAMEREIRQEFNRKLFSYFDNLVK